MPTAADALIQMEQGASLVPFALLTDSGDQKIFTPAAPVLSGKAGQEPDLRPNGIISGYDMVTPAVSGSNDVVDYAAFNAYSKGVKHEVAAGTDLSITRPTTNVLISSITMDDTGAVAVVAGTEGAAFVETRGAGGGPPFIPADSCEVAQVLLDSPTAAPITAAEIFQVPGQHSERFDFPNWKTPINGIGEGLDADVSAKTNAYVEFLSTLPTIHTGSTAKRVYLQYYSPIIADLSDTVDFVPVETSHTVSSRQVYRRSVSSTSESLGQGGFTALVDDGVNDALSKNKNQVLTFKFFPNMNKPAYILTQGKLGIVRSYPASDQIEVSATISANFASADFSG